MRRGEYAVPMFGDVGKFGVGGNQKESWWVSFVEHDGGSDEERGTDGG